MWLDFHVHLSDPPTLIRAAIFPVCLIWQPLHAGGDLCTTDKIETVTLSMSIAHYLRLLQWEDPVWTLRTHPRMSCHLPAVRLQGKCNRLIYQRKPGASSFPLCEKSQIGKKIQSIRTSLCEKAKLTNKLLLPLQ